MIIRLALLFLVFLSVASAGDETATITIQCDSEGRCSASPPLGEWPRRLAIQSSDTWNCAIQPAGEDRLFPCNVKVVPVSHGHHIRLVLTSTTNSRHRVTLSVSAGPSVGLPIAATLSSGMVLLTGCLVLLLTVAVRREWAKCGTALVQHLDNRPGANNPQSSASALLPTTAAAVPTPAPALEHYPGAVVNGRHLRDTIEQVAQASTACFQALAAAPKAGFEWVESLRSLGVAADPVAAQDKFPGIARTLAKLAVSAVDDERERTRQANPNAEKALTQLVELAGLALLTAKACDIFVSDRHAATGDIVPTTALDNRNTVARTVKRGLIDLESSAVVTKAQVALYEYKPSL